MLETAQVSVAHRAFVKRLRTLSPSEWREAARQQELAWFRRNAKHVRAYNDFLVRNSIVPEKVKAPEDLDVVPWIDKVNYLSQYEPSALVLDGELSGGPNTLYATSGSTGDPFYFRHGRRQDEQYARYAALYMSEQFLIGQRKTLFVNCFPMGAWIGGVFTSRMLQICSDTFNFPIVCANVGLDVNTAADIVKKTVDEFDQVVIGAYGPFMRDILDAGVSTMLRERRKECGFVFAAERISELFRNRVLEECGRPGEYFRTTNQYGTVDLGTMAFETPGSISFNRAVIQNAETAELIRRSRGCLPTVAQYDPTMFRFSQCDEMLLCSADSGYPVVRYNLHDYGWCADADQMDHWALAIKDNDEWNHAHSTYPLYRSLPYVAVYDRDDFSVSYFAFKLYPAMIEEVFLRREFNNLLSGRFCMLSLETTGGTPRLQIDVELAELVPASRVDVGALATQISDELTRHSSEYRQTLSAYGNRVMPNVVLHDWSSTKLFERRGKQKWTRREPINS